MLDFSLPTEFDYELLRFLDQNIGLMAGVTRQQGISTPLLYLPCLPYFKFVSFLGFTRQIISRYLHEYVSTTVFSLSSFLLLLILFVNLPNTSYVIYFKHKIVLRQQNAIVLN